MDTTLLRPPSPESSDGVRTTMDEALIGPNAVTRTLDAVTERFGGEFTKTLRHAAGIPATVPEVMIPERWFERLVAELRRRTPEATSRAILRSAGAVTAAYVTRNRIPAPVRGLLRLLPPPLALPLLLRAVGRHAWTFAGRGEFAHSGGVLTLSDPPTCRAVAPAAAPSGSRPFGGAYYEAAFEGILSLAAPDVTVREVACIRTGAPACRFRLDRAVHATSPSLDRTPAFARSS